MEGRKPYLATLPGLILGCLVCCALWGSAFPASRSATHSLASARDSASQLLFAGLRFTLAGALVIVGMSVVQRRPLIPQARDIKPICILSLFQTIGQYFFFYLGLSRASPCRAPSSRPAPTSSAILFAALAFHTEAQCGQGAWLCAGLCRCRARQPLGRRWHFWLYARWRGLYPSLPLSAGALSTCLIGIFSREHDGVLLCRVAVLVGGVVLTAIGFFDGRHVVPPPKSPPPSRSSSFTWRLSPRSPTRCGRACLPSTPSAASLSLDL